jgi:hypothetical protein
MKKSKWFILVLFFGITTVGLVLVSFVSITPTEISTLTSEIDEDDVDKTCVFNTVMGIQASDSFFVFTTPEKVELSLQTSIQWMAGAQLQDGGWGCGSHSNQGNLNPLKVDSDPATTSVVLMALMRMGHNHEKGSYTKEFKKGGDFILVAVEKSAKEDNNITALRGTQIQTKLGQNIDVVLAAQFLSNWLEDLGQQHNDFQRVMSALNACTEKIQRSMNADGSVTNAGWAGVLQSSFATNALESAAANGATVDLDGLEKAREYQKGNTDTKTGNVKTEAGAGIVLYSVSGSARASAQDARKVEERVNKAKAEGNLPAAAEVTVDNLTEIGYTEEEAMRYTTSYTVYNTSKEIAQRQDVTTGFGNDGGEEYLSFLQTGESLIIGGDDSWKTWYDNISGRLLSAQNQNGSWHGHHCITSPVFCTATAMLILSIHNDIEKLAQLGE